MGITRLFAKYKEQRPDEVFDGRKGRAHAKVVRRRKGREALEDGEQAA